MTSKGIPKSRVGALYITHAVPLVGSVNDMQAAWLTYAIKDLDPNAVQGIATCYVGTESSVSASRDAKIAVWRGSHIIDVDWKYATSMTALSSKPGAVYSYCNSGTFASDKTVYDTGVFEIPRDDAMSTNSPVEVTFANYLIKEKKATKPFSQWYSMSLSCPHSFATRAQAQEQHDKMEASFRATGKTIVALPWTYARNADTPAASPRPSNKH
ncbi:MAG TPA: hypothetical protein VJL35_03850 [Gemmatimonadaceae bacterium]|nr:hypothetical protein [Gemmatimonadaceae bacterium]